MIHTPTRSSSSARHSEPALKTGPDHDEWAIDESLQETFPASDPTSPARPGSLVGMRNAQALRTRGLFQLPQLPESALTAAKKAGPWVLAAGAIAWLALTRGKRRR